MKPLLIYGLKAVVSCMTCGQRVYIEPPNEWKDEDAANVFMHHSMVHRRTCPGPIKQRRFKSRAA